MAGREWSRDEAKVLNGGKGSVETSGGRRSRGEERRSGASAASSRCALGLGRF